MLILFVSGGAIPSNRFVCKPLIDSTFGCSVADPVGNGWVIDKAMAAAAVDIDIVNNCDNLLRDLLAA